MKQLKIIHDRGWPSQTFHKQGREMKNVHLRQCVVVTRLVMESYDGERVLAEGGTVFSLYRFPTEDSYFNFVQGVAQK
ncbi:hypothetical protein ETC05_07765 [Geobacillus sp. BMUD]|nr:hypothetical protein [Geobacillus sp. BMUD]